MFLPKGFYIPTTFSTDAFQGFSFWWQYFRFVERWLGTIPLYFNIYHVFRFTRFEFFPFILFDPPKYCCPIVLNNFSSPSRADITSVTTTRPQVSISHVSLSSSRSKAGIKDSKGSNILDIVHWMKKNSLDFRNQPKRLFTGPLIYGNYFISSNYTTEMSNRYFCF